MRHKMILRLKSGRELRFTCDEYKIGKLAVTGELTDFGATNAHGECPVYFNIDDVEAIIEVKDEEGLEDITSDGRSCETCVHSPCSINDWPCNLCKRSPGRREYRDYYDET